MIKAFVLRLNTQDEPDRFCAYIRVANAEEYFGYREYEREDFAWTHINNLKRMCEAVHKQTQKDLREVLGMEK